MIATKGGGGGNPEPVPFQTETVPSATSKYPIRLLRSSPFFLEGRLRSLHPPTDGFKVFQTSVLPQTVLEQSSNCLHCDVQKAGGEARVRA